MGAGRNTQPGALTRAIATILNDAFLELLQTQQQFGQTLRIPQSTLSNYLRGHTVIDIEVLAALCKALDLDLVNVIETAVANIDSDFN
ncbi:MAG TPA: helix-turn-helix transcriptional regulator [Galbitalea sp.]